MKAKTWAEWLEDVKPQLCETARQMAADGNGSAYVWRRSDGTWMRPDRTCHHPHVQVEFQPGGHIISRSEF